MQKVESLNYQSQKKVHRSAYKSVYLFSSYILWLSYDFCYLHHNVGVHVRLLPPPYANVKHFNAFFHIIFTLFFAGFFYPRKIKILRRRKRRYFAEYARYS